MYARMYPVNLVLPNGATLRIQYKEPRCVLQVGAFCNALLVIIFYSSDLCSCCQINSPVISRHELSHYCDQGGKNCKTLSWFDPILNNFLFINEHFLFNNICNIYKTVNHSSRFPQLPIDLNQCSEEERQRRLLRRKPRARLALQEEVDDSFDVDSYSFLWSSGKKTKSGG